jgi:hypothetical protein
VTTSEPAWQQCANRILNSRMINRDDRYDLF